MSEPQTDAEPGGETAPRLRTGRRWRRLAIRAAAVLLLLIVLFYVGRALVRGFLTVRWGELAIAPHWIVLAVLCWAGAAAVNVLLNRVLLGFFVRPPAWGVLAAVTWLPPLGKYVPGKVASLVGAVWLLRRHGIPGAVAGAVVVIRQGLSIIAGMMVAAPLMLWQPVRERVPMAPVWCGLVLAAGLVLLHPRVFGGVSGFVLRKLGREPLPRLPSLGQYVLPAALAAANWVLFGLALWFTSLTVGAVGLEDVPFVVFAGAMAGTVGYLAFFAPAGLGVREGILLLALTEVLGGQPAAALVVVAARLLHTLVEVAQAGAGYAILRHHHRKEQAGA